MRQIELTGHLVADAERKISKTGKEYLSFRIGSNEFNDKDEQGNQKTYWFNVTTFNQRHFGIAQYLTKGKSIIIVGDYSDRLYQNREGNCDIARVFRIHIFRALIPKSYAISYRRICHFLTLV